MQHYDSFRNGVVPQARPTMDRLREFCLGLGGVESVRAHRVVYGRGMTHRWFADIEPDTDHTTLKTSRGWRHPPLVTVIPHGEDISDAKEMIRAAFDSV